MRAKIRVEKIKNSFVIEEEKSYQKLFSKGFSQKVGSFFELDIYETLYLIEKGKIEVFSNSKEFLFNDLIKGVDLKNYVVFKDLRDKGHRVKSGLKYGFVFRVYDKKNLDKHSLWLVEPILESDKFKVQDLAGKNRIAHSTKKKMMLAVVDIEGGITYIENHWVKI